ncbi:N/A [soil metagenome]
MADPTRLFLPLHIVAAGATDIGRVRVHNEDAVLLRPDLDLYILADGAGGHNAGNVASALATTAIANFFAGTGHGRGEEPDTDAYGMPIVGRRLAAAVQRANDDILEIAKSSNKLRGMGTTAVAIAALRTTGQLHVAHVGDSRLYRWRDGVLELLTHDHSLLNDALEIKPNISDTALARLPANVVTRALGMEPQIRVSTRMHRMLAGDKYLLCSDGISDTLDEDMMGDTLAIDRAPDELARALIAKANALEAQDNLGAIVLVCSLAPNASSVPRIVHTPSRRPPAGHSDDPEIVILSVDGDEDGGQSFAAVPAEAVDEEFIEAIEEFTKNK